MARILIVEDDLSVSLLISTMLRNLRHEIIGIAVAAQQAYTLIEEKNPELILMDIMLKGNTDGIDAAAFIKKKFDIPFIYITALFDDNSFRRAKKTEPSSYLLKPFDIKDLQIAIDVALHKYEADRKRKESQLWLKSTLESIGDGVIAVCPDRKIKFLNSAAERLTGFNKAEAEGNSLDAVYNTHPDTTVEGIMCLANNAGDYEKCGKTKILCKKEGAAILIEENESAIVDDKGDEQGRVIIFKDITQKRENELTIIAARGFYLNFFEKFPIPIWRTNDAGEFNYFNTAWLELTGENIETQIFQGWIKRLHPEEKETFMRKFNDAFIKKEKFEIEFRLADQYSEYKWMICVANPFYDLKGNFNGYVGMCLDITNRKALEEELLRDKNLSDAANKAKGYFISHMSHELRTPLNGIMGLTELLMGTKLTGEQKEYMGLLKSSSNSLLEQLNNLLDYAKIEDKKEPVQTSVFDFKILLEELINTYNIQAQNKGVSLVCSYNGNLPEELIGDEKKIKRVIMNLLSNAVKFTFKGSIKISIDMAVNIQKYILKENELLFHIMVADTGIGIPVEKQSMIFNSFTQIDSSFTKKYSGTGLGLTIAKRLVEMMGGAIWLNSAQSRGSEFHFTVPLKIGSADKHVLLNNNLATL